jgi:hypothetical protein
VRQISDGRGLQDHGFQNPDTHADNAPGRPLWRTVFIWWFGMRGDGLSWNPSKRPPAKMLNGSRRKPRIRLRLF